MQSTRQRPTHSERFLYTTSRVNKDDSLNYGNWLAEPRSYTSIYLLRDDVVLGDDGDEEGGSCIDRQQIA